jgi:hypothetical protein
MAMNSGLAHARRIGDIPRMLVASTPRLANNEVAAATIAGRFVPGFP